jgi:crotonobetainyl-CoA:carnitine CoA-transferase CaiB-like acyl-CoA transferase
MLGGDMPNNPVFELDNRSKQSIVLDLQTAAGRAIALELIDGADVFLSNIRPNALERIGLGYEAVAPRNPRLIYAIVTGYGLEGPDANRAAYDIAAFWARSGIASLLTAPDADPPFQRGGMGDHSVGLSTAAAISAALFARERTGRGQMVSTSLLRQGVYTIGFDLNMVLGWGLTTAVGTRHAMGNPAINNYTAGDGRRFWIVGLEGERHWPPLARAVGHPEWLDDERFSTAASRAKNARELIGELDRIFATKTLDEWSKVFETESDFFWSPINTVDDVLADPQLAHAGGLVVVPDGSSGTTMIASPADFHGTPWAPRSLAPKLGEHTRDVLAALGKSGEVIDELIASGVARDATDN